MLLALFTLACSPSGTRGAAPVVVAIDTLRADHLDALGVPFTGCRRYTRAHSASPYTSSSTYALLTGRLPSGQFKAPPADQPGPIRTADLWPEVVMQDQNVVARLVGAEPSARTAKQLGSPGLLTAAAEWVSATEQRGMAGYIHAVGPHDPYDGLRVSDGVPRLSRASGRLRRAGYQRSAELTADEQAWVRVQYRQAVAETGWNLAPVVDAAASAGRLLIVTSDHGEALGEDGRWLHGTSLHDPQIHVPLVVCGLGVVPGEDSTPVGPLCVAETVTGRGPCDLRTGEGLRAGTAGMLVDGEWVTRDVGAEWAAVAEGGSAG